MHVLSGGRPRRALPRQPRHRSSRCSRATACRRTRTTPRCSTCNAARHRFTEKSATDVVAPAQRARSRCSRCSSPDAAARRQPAVPGRLCVRARGEHAPRLVRARLPAAQPRRPCRNRCRRELQKDLELLQAAPARVPRAARARRLAAQRHPRRQGAQSLPRARRRRARYGGASSAARATRTSRITSGAGWRCSRRSARAMRRAWLSSPLRSSGNSRRWLPMRANIYCSRRSLAMSRVAPSRRRSSYGAPTALRSASRGRRSVCCAAMPTPPGAARPSAFMRSAEAPRRSASRPGPCARKRGCSRVAPPARATQAHGPATTPQRPPPPRPRPGARKKPRIAPAARRSRAARENMSRKRCGCSSAKAT